MDSKSTKTNRFVIKGSLPSLNDIIDAAKGSGGTGRGYSTMKKKLTNDLALQILSQRVQRFTEAVTLTFEYWEASRRRDPDNIAAGKKFILDSLVHCKVLQGDGWRHVVGFNEYFDIDAANPRVVVTIELA